MQFWFVRVFPKNLKCSTLSNDLLPSLLITNLTHNPFSSSSSSSSSSCSWRVRHVSLFLNSQDEVVPSISSSVVLWFFVLLVYIVVLVLVVCLCPSSVRVVATFPGTVSFSYIYLFQFSTCFEQPSAHHQKSQLYQYDLCCVSLWKHLNDPLSKNEWYYL